MRSRTAPHPHYILSPPPHRLTSLSRSPPTPRRQSHSHIVQALGDTFRIGPGSAYSAPESISDSTWRALRQSGPAQTTSPSVTAATGSVGGSVGAEEEDREEDDFLVIPHFGDSVIELDVQALLGSHGIRTRRALRRSLSHHDEDEGEEERDEDGDEDDDGDTNTGSARADYEYTPMRTGSGRRRGRRWVRRRRRSGGGDEMEVDRVESECSSCAPSRSTSPSLTSTLVTSPSPSAVGRASLTPPPASLSVQQQQCQMTYVEHLDIAGTCFDPSGRFVYVGATESVVEWGIRGSEKRWWSGTQWM